MEVNCMKPLSRKPYVLFLQDDNGDLFHVRLDPSLISSQNAIIVLDEINDTCWVWIGRDVNMPTRMHALRMSKSVQKSGYAVGATTIGMSLSHLIEMMEKDDSDPDVATNIASFRNTIGKKWNFDDSVLAFDAAKASTYEAKPPTIVDHAAPATKSTSKPPKVERPIEIIAKTVQDEPMPAAVSTEPGLAAEKKAAFLLYSAIKNTDIVYTERFERDGNNGLKIEAPGILVIEALMKGNDLLITPPEFGDSEQAHEIKKTYESWLRKI